MSYQITIDGESISNPMEKAEAAAWVGLLRVTFPGATIEAEPLTCPNCGNPLPDSGPCWHNRFVEEEIVTSEEMIGALIPFQGEPMEPRVITESDEYF